MISIGMDPTLFNALLVPCGSIVVDTVAGIILSLKNKDFSVSKLPQFIATNVFMYIGGLCVFAYIATYVPALSYFYYGCIGFVTLKYSKEALLDKAKQIFLGKE